MNRFPSYLRVTLLATLLATFWLANMPSASARASTAPEKCGSWQVVASPSPLAASSPLWGVAAISDTDVWAVGGSEINTPRLYPLNSGITEHWDGTQWSIIPSPEPGNYQNFLYSVAALASNNAWAVGLYQDAQRRYEEREKTLIEQWDGMSWSVIASPSPGTYTNELTAVTALSANDIWAVGFNWAAPGNILDALAEHWDGSKWSIVSVPNPPGEDNDLAGIAALASDNMWAVGATESGVLIEHWDGKQWNIVAAPRLPYPFLDNIVALNAHDMWAVGDTESKTLTLHYC